MTKAELLAMLRENRALFERMLGMVPAARMTDDSGWSGKDIVAHITAWEQRLIGWLIIAARDETPQIPAPGMTWGDIDALNAVIYARDRDRPLDDVLAASGHSFQQLLEQIDVFAEADLIYLRRYAWMEGKPLWRRVTAGPGYGHYQGHLYDLLRLCPPDQMYQPDAATLARLAGTYGEPDRRIAVRVEGDRLVINHWDHREEKACLAIDDARYVYESGGMLAFHATPGGGVTGLENWSYEFAHMEEP